MVQLTHVVFVLEEPVFLSRQFLLCATGKLIAIIPRSIGLTMASLPMFPISRVSNTVAIAFHLAITTKLAK
jgi:hypothetical protein